MSTLIDGITTLFAEGWEAFYKDGSSYSSLDYDWHEIPKDGVLSIIIWHKYHIPGVRQKTILAGNDYYYYEANDDWGCTNDYSVAKEYDFKRGIWTVDEYMAEVQRKVFEKLDNG